MLRGTSVFRGCTIQAKDGKAGHVSDVLFDGTTWKIRWLVIDTGSWANERLVLIHPSSIGETDGQVDRLYIELTKDEIANSPDIFQDPPVSRQSDLGVSESSDTFWDDAGLATASAAYPSVASPSEAYETDQQSSSYVRTDNQDPNLRSALEVSGYYIRAIDGDIGHLLEFLIDDEAWAIRYLIVDTRNWLSGPHVMLKPPAVVEIDFWRRVVRLNITREQVRNSPAAWKAETSEVFE
jgi:hypothetical protein